MVVFVPPLYLSVSHYAAASANWVGKLASAYQPKMPPRRKINSSSSSKKPNVSNQQSQPSKFGIQHFFERHTQNALVATHNHPSSPPNALLSAAPKSPIPDHNPLSSSNANAAALPLPLEAASSAVVSHSASQNPKIDSDSSADKPPAIDVNVEVSPSVSKSTSLKRFNFSPGMVNKFSAFFPSFFHFFLHSLLN